MGLWTGRSLSLPAKWDRAALCGRHRRRAGPSAATVEETEAMLKLAPAGE
jgi:hypothetical protein